MIKFRCPHCQQKLGVPEAYAGRRIRCNKCSEPSVVPPSGVSQVPVSKEVTHQANQAVRNVAAGGGAGASQTTAHQTSTAALTSQGSYASVKRQPKPASEPNGLDELEVVDAVQDDDAARREAIRLAVQNRRRATQKPPREKGGGRSESKSSGRQKSDRLSLLEMVPDFLRVPLGIVLGFVASGLTVLLWVICSRTTSNALCFMAVFVPIAAAFVFRGLVTERGFLIGVLCVIIGGLSIAGGKAAIAHFVVIPFFQETASEEVLVNLSSLMADPKLQFTGSDSIKPYARDGDYMTCAGLVAMVEEGVADPVKARAWAVHIMQHSNKLSLVEMFDSATGGGTVPEPIPDLTSEDESVFDKVSMRLAQWSEEETELQMARKYYPAVAKITQQAMILHTFEDQKLTYQLAFLNTLGLFDLVWIFMGLGIAYAVTVFD